MVMMEEANLKAQVTSDLTRKLAAVVTTQSLLVERYDCSLRMIDPD